MSLQKAQDIINLVQGAPGPYLENETSFFGKKRVNSSMKEALMETDCGGMIITKGKLTYGEADALAAAVDLSDYQIFVSSLTPTAYWRSPFETPQPAGRHFVGEVWWSIYSFLCTKGIIDGDPKSYHNGMEYLYNEILKRLVKNGVYTVDSEWRWFTRGNL